VVSSLLESFGYPVLEGAFFNKPVIVRNENLIEILKRFKCVNYFVWKDDLSEVIDKVKEVKKNEFTVNERIGGYSNSEDVFEFLLEAKSKESGED
jgi:glycosyltransferase involved in cell wall biosynthesis